jgi:hypothetical protein
VRLKCKILDCKLTEGALQHSSNAKFSIAKTHKHVKANVLLCTSLALLGAVFNLISRHEMSLKFGRNKCVTHTAVILKLRQNWTRARGKRKGQST